MEDVPLIYKFIKGFWYKETKTAIHDCEISRVGFVLAMKGFERKHVDHNTYLYTSETG